MNTKKVNNKGTRGKRDMGISFFQEQIKAQICSGNKKKKKKTNPKQEKPMSLKGFDNLMYLLLTSAFEKQYRRATTKP